MRFTLVHKVTPARTCNRRTFSSTDARNCSADPFTRISWSWEGGPRSWTLNDIILMAYPEDRSSVSRRLDTPLQTVPFLYGWLNYSETSKRPPLIKTGCCCDRFSVPSVVFIVPIDVTACTSFLFPENPFHDITSRTVITFLHQASRKVFCMHILILHVDIQFCQMWNSFLLHFTLQCETF